MKITSLRLVALVFVAIAMSFVIPSKASAAYVSIRVGTPPPPLIVEHPWARPYRDAVWIGGHHEWVNGAWVWVGGYYAYPPRHGAYWVRAHYNHGYYYPGHWN
jgi:hypothetical protein